MVSTGDTAPTFTAPLANGDVDEFDIEAALDEEAPIVLAFFPGAFTGVCTHEMNTFQDRIESFSEAGATVYGVSIDAPWVLNEFRDELGLSFDMISDVNRDLIETFDLAMDFDSMGVENLAKRSVFVVDEDGEVTYSWVSDDPGVEPDYDEVLAAAEAASD